MLKIALAHLKRLRSFEIELAHFSPDELMNIVVGSVYQATQIKTLVINFVSSFEIDSSVCAIIKKLQNQGFSNTASR